MPESTGADEQKKHGAELQDHDKEHGRPSRETHEAARSATAAPTANGDKDDEKLRQIHAELSDQESAGGAGEADNVTTEELSEEKILELLRACNGDIHKASPEVTEWLAEKHKIYTTGEPRDPGSLVNFLKERQTARQLERLRDNARKAIIKHIPELKNEKHLGYKLAEILGSVTDVKLGSVYAMGYPLGVHEELGGKVYTDKITYTVGSKAEAKALKNVFSALLRTASEDEVFPVDWDEGDNGTYIVEVGNYSEYANRVMGNAIDQLFAEDHKKTTGATLPPEKMDLKSWKARGETFDPRVEAKLEEINEQYQNLGDEKAKAFRRSQGKAVEALGTDSAWIFKAARDGFRPTIRQIRKGDNLNTEQNPDLEERLLIERNVNLTRDETPQDAQHPSAARAHTTTERLQANMRGRFEGKTRAEKAVEVAKIGTAVLGLGLESAAEFVLDNALSTSVAGKELAADRQAWEEQRKRFEASRAKITRLAA